MLSLSPVSFHPEKQARPLEDPHTIKNHRQLLCTLARETHTHEETGAHHVHAPLTLTTETRPHTRNPTQRGEGGGFGGASGSDT